LETSVAGYVQRLIGAAKLDASTYEEVEADRGATAQALLTVVLSSVLAGIGASGLGDAGGLLWMALLALGGWVVWAFITWFVGTKLLPEPQTQSDPGELLRTLGFASAPGFLRVLLLIPVFGRVVAAVVAIWMLLAMVVAVRQALDYKSTGRALLVCGVGFAFYVVLGIVFGGLLSRPAAS
jgi:hypothetical protein